MAQDYSPNFSMPGLKLEKQLELSFNSHQRQDNKTTLDSHTHTVTPLTLLVPGLDSFKVVYQGISLHSSVVRVIEEPHPLIFSKVVSFEIDKRLDFAPLSLAFRNKRGLNCIIFTRLSFHHIVNVHPPRYR